MVGARDAAWRERPQVAGNQDRAALASSSMRSSLVCVVSFFRLNRFCFSMLMVNCQTTVLTGAVPLVGRRPAR